MVKGVVAGICNNSKDAESDWLTVTAPDGAVALSNEGRARRAAREFQAAATVARDVPIAAARKMRYVRADVRWRWTLKLL